MVVYKIITSYTATVMFHYLSPHARAWPITVQARLKKVIQHTYFVEFQPAFAKKCTVTIGRILFDHYSGGSIQIDSMGLAVSNCRMIDNAGQKVNRVGIYVEVIRVTDFFKLFLGVVQQMTDLVKILDLLRRYD
jgi:hypothetical protein